MNQDQLQVLLKQLGDVVFTLFCHKRDIKLNVSDCNTKLILVDNGHMDYPMQQPVTIIASLIPLDAEQVLVIHNYCWQLLLSSQCNDFK